MEWEEASVCAGPLLKVTLREPGERLTFTAPARSIKKSNQRMFAGIPNQIMPDERSSGFERNLSSRGTNWSLMSLIGEHVDVCNPPIAKRLICPLEAPPGSLNEGIFSNILRVNKDLTWPASFTWLWRFKAKGRAARRCWDLWRSQATKSQFVKVSQGEKMAGRKI